MNAPTVRRVGIAALEARLGVERTTISRWCRAGTFPAPHYLGARRAWFIAEIEAWERERMARPPQPRRPGDVRAEAARGG